MGENNNTAGSDIMEKYYRETFPKIMGGVRKGIKQYAQEFGENRQPFRLTFNMPGKKNYQKLSLLFEPDYREDKKYRLFAEVPLRWNPSYSVKNQLLKGTPEELCAWIGSPECEETIKQVSVHLDESERHDGF